jgi:hypothetical protein
MKETMRVELTEILIALQYDHEGRLVMVDGLLAAVLVKLSDVHGPLKGRWSLETGYGALENKEITFPDLPAALNWIRTQLAGTKSRIA